MNRATPVSGWPWPLQIDAYDRTTTLSDNERKALWSLFGSAEQPKPLKKRGRAALALERILRPIEDVFSSIRAHMNTTYHVRRLLLAEMYHRDQTFWGWPLETWCDVLAPSRAAFAQRNGWSYVDDHDGRPQVVALAYLLCPHIPFGPLLTHIQCFALARSVFGQTPVREAAQRIQDLLRGWGYEQHYQVDLLSSVGYLLLSNRSPSLTDLSPAAFEEAIHTCPLQSSQHTWYRISRALTALGILEKPLSKPKEAGFAQTGSTEHIAEEWLAYCNRWLQHSPSQRGTRIGCYYQLLKTGRWLQAVHPEITSPAQWTSDLAAEFIAAVQEMKVGEWLSPGYHIYLAAEHRGKALKPAARMQLIHAMRVFLRDCQEWTWIEPRLNVARALRPPRSLRDLIRPNPRVVDRAFWAKILWAAMNLEREDLPIPGAQNDQPHYPLELVRALAVVWCFTALRADEIRRLRVGCIRWQSEDVMVQETGELLPRDAVCFLDIPVNKTSTAYTKPVHPVVGKWITAWETVRPQEQLRTLDTKTGELVQYLFSYRGKPIAASYLNGSLIPILCRKAGVPLEDSRGKITSHRARATIASMLYNAKEPLSILELKEYLGHKQLSSTQYYLKVDPTKLASQVTKAGYLEQNMASIEVLLDQEAVLSGAAANGTPWKYYDLGHGFCTNPFWAQCAHRMACARCPYYCPKDTTYDQLLEGKANLVRMLEFVQLTDDEQQLVTDGIEVHQALIEKLADVPTPAGLTPRELQTQQPGAMPVIPLQPVGRRRQAGAPG